MRRTRTVAIAGGGRVGLETAISLADRGHDVSIVERDPERCAVLTERFLGTVIEGDARRPSVIEQLDPDRCAAIAALTGDTATNAGICLTADRMGEIRTVLRVTDPEETPEYADLGDSIVHPERSAAGDLANELVGGSVRQIEGVADSLQLLEIEVAPSAPAAGKHVEDVAFPHHSLVIAGPDGLCLPETTIVGGKRYLVAVDPREETDVLELLRG